MRDRTASRRLPATRAAMPQKDMLDVWHALLTAVFDPYRPELHYMRGPGPKWRAKHAYVPDASLDCPLHRIAA